VCSVCSKFFESQSKLDDHYRKHTGEKPFLCNICGSSFRYKGDRTKHLKNLHGATSARLPPPLLPPPTAASETSATVVMSDERSGAVKTTMEAFGDGGGDDKMPSPMLASESSANSAARGAAKSEPVESSPPPPLSLFPMAAAAVDEHSLVSALLPIHQAGQPAATAEETVTIALDEVMQFAQPTVVTEYY